MAEVPFRFDLGIPPPFDALVKWGLGLSEAERVYRRLQRQLRVEPPHAAASGAFVFSREALKALGVSYTLPLEKIASLRKLNGPLLFVANHPFGAVDALVLLVLLGEVRGAAKFLANSILNVFPELKGVLLPVHIMGSDVGPAKNLAAMRTAVRYLTDGGLIGVFPAGEVSEATSFRSKVAVEKAWHESIGRIANISRATVVPLYFSGQNSALFQLIGLTLPKLRIAFLARELLRHKKPIVFTIGEPISPKDYRDGRSASEISAYLRARTLSLNPERIGSTVAQGSAHGS